MAQLLAKFRARPIKSFEKKVHHIENSDPLSPLYTKISDFASQGSESMSLKKLVKCFDLIDLTTKAFSKLLVELDYPVEEWGCVATEEYLSYTLNLLSLLNSVHSSVSHLKKAQFSILRALSGREGSQPLEKIPVINLGKELEFEEQGSCGVVIKKPGSEKERVILQALSLVKTAGYLALGFVTMGLCSNERPYSEIRKLVKGFKDSPPPQLVKNVDSMFHEAVVQGICEEIRDVNCSVERINGGKLSGEDVVRLRTKLEVMEGLIEVIEKQGNELFSQVLAARSELLERFIDRELAYM